MTLKTSLTICAGAAALSLASGEAAAQTDHYIGDVMLTGATFCPVGFLEADGSVVSIMSYTALYSLIGANYGGNGTTTFALPDLSTRLPIHRGPNWTWTQMGGSETRQMSIATMPAHTHEVDATDAAPDTTSPDGATFATFYSGPNRYAAATPDAAMQTSPVETVSSTGAGAPFSILGPTYSLRYCINVAGLYPPHP